MKATWLVLFAVGVIGCGPKALRPDQQTQARLEEEAKVGGYAIVDATEVAELVKERADMVILDVRTEKEYRERHLVGATNIPFPIEGMTGEWKPERMGNVTAEDFGKQLGKDKEIRVVIYGEDFQDDRSHHAATWARKLGFKDVKRFAGGLAAWTASGQPTRSLQE